VYNGRSAAFNAALWSVLDELEAGNPVLEFHRLDVAGLFGQALQSPGAFGLTNVTSAAAPGLQPGASSYNTNQIAANPDEYLFWDDLHPTAAVHAILAERALSLLLMLPGDYNGDHEVNAADYTVWRNSLGATGAGLAADGDGDRRITLLDYDVWKAHYGESDLDGLSTFSSIDVPEPRAWGLLALGILVFAMCGRRSQNQVRSRTVF
jgi:hypothetical protein